MSVALCKRVSSIQMYFIYIQSTVKPSEINLEMKFETKLIGLVIGCKHRKSFKNINKKATPLFKCNII